MHYNIAICAGTFDRLHKGHREFLRFILSSARRTIIGVTTQTYLSKYKQGYGIESYAKRNEALKSFIQKEGKNRQATVLPINDVYGPTLDFSFRADAIFVTQETKKGAMLVNQKRKALGLSPIPIVEYSLIMADDGQPISSTRIRAGKISREGKMFLAPSFFDHPLYLPEYLRKELQKPFGQFIVDFNEWLNSNSINPKKTITVGDIVTKTCNEKKIGQKISVIDYHVERKRRFSHMKEHGFKGNEKQYVVNNPAGTLTPDLFRVVRDIFQIQEDEDRQVVAINGEEDLAVLPVVLAAPLGDTILYGQPGVGVVVIVASEEKKEEAYKIVGLFEDRFDKK